MPRKRVKDMPRKQQEAVMSKYNFPIHVRDYTRKYHKAYEKSYCEISPKKTNYFVEMKNLIEEHPEETKQILANIALWGGCVVAPEICPIIKSVYHLYKGRQTVFNMFDGDIKYDYNLFHSIFQKQFNEEMVNSIFPPTVYILARKAEYAHYILNELNNFEISDEEYIHTKKLVLSNIYNMEDKAFFTKDEETEHSIRITDYFNIDKNKLLNAFEMTLRKNDMSLYASLLVYIGKQQTNEL